MGDAVDARVSTALLAVALNACVGSGGDPVGAGAEDACRPRTIVLERTGEPAVDYGVWEVDITTPRGVERCSASRGTWLCSNPRFDARSFWGEPDSTRGLARKTILWLAADDYSEMLGYRYTIRRNGVTRYTGPTLCGTAPCGAGNPNLSATLPLGGPP